jgi:hypothetical protein
MFDLVKNYGNSSEIVLSSDGGIRYVEILQQSNFIPFNASRFIVISTDQPNLNQTLIFNYQDANGRDVQDPVNMAIYDDIYQISQTIQEIKYKCRVDGTFSIEGNITANTSMKIIIFPDLIADLKNTLDEGDIEDALKEEVYDCMKPSRLTKPYVINLRNTADQNLPFVIFGQNKYLNYETI